MLGHIRSFLIVIEEGSLRRAAARLNISQSALSRQMQLLESELGGSLLERFSTGIRPTQGGHALAKRFGPFLEGYEVNLMEVRRLLRGQSERLNVGYVGSAAQDHLNPALAKLRKIYPEAIVRLHDLSPGEQITALRRGEIDVALTDQGGEILALDFYTRKLATVPSLAIVAEDHPLASRKQLRVAELKGETFVNGLDCDMPGYNRRITQFCRKLGKFRARFIGRPQSLAEGLELVAHDNAVLLLPEFVRCRARRGVSFIPIVDSKANWDLFVVWRRGKVAKPLRILLESFAFPTPK